MLVEKKRLIELSSHEDDRVINAAAEALQKFFPCSEGVMSHLLRLINSGRRDTLGMAVKVKYFVPTDEDLLEILRLINESGHEKDGDSLSLNFHLVCSLFEFPFELLERNHTSFSFDNKLIELYETAKNRAEMKKREAGVLWQELEEICARYPDKEMEQDDRLYCEVLTNALHEKGEEIVHKVKSCLSRSLAKGGYFEIHLVELAGKLKIKETVPYLFEILKTSDVMDIISGVCTWSLGQIGTPEVAAGVDAFCRSDKELRDSAGEILKHMPYDYAEETAIKLLGENYGKAENTFLAGALCDIFSIKGAGLVLDMIEKQEYDPSIMELLEYLVPVYVYHNETIPGLRELEARDKGFCDKQHEANPLFSIAKGFQPLLEEGSILEEGEDETGEEEEDKKKGRITPASRFPSKKRHKKKKKKKGKR